MRLYSFARFLRPKCLIAIFLFLCSILVLNKVVGLLFISKSSSSYTGFILQRSDSIRKFLKLQSKVRPRRLQTDKLLERGHFSTSFDDNFGNILSGSSMPFKHTNKSFCNFKYGTDTLNWVENISFSPELGEEGPYRVLYNIIEVKLNHNNTKHSHLEVTYCTHATPTFIHHLVEIVRRWDGLVSITVFVPGYDAFLSLVIIHQLCNCIPEMSKISLHFIFPAMHPPIFTAPPSISKFFKNTEAPNKLLVKDVKTYKEQNDLVYPVNVARNVARVGAKTIYVLVSDVELLPSRNLVPEFLSMIENFQHKHSILPFLQPSFALEERSVQKFVFVLPVFEVETTDLDIPQTKEELLYLYGKSKAVYFHRWVCLHCQRFPGLQRWLKHKKTGGPASQIKPLLIVRREFPYHRWEPVYIGTNLEPWYSELLSWEGQQDKMTQMNEMCLLGYRFVILDQAFLVHIPGMKQRSDVTIERTAWRKPHERRNIQIYKSIAESMLKKYKENKRCKI